MAVSMWDVILNVYDNLSVIIHSKYIFLKRRFTKSANVVVKWR